MAIAALAFHFLANSTMAFKQLVSFLLFVAAVSAQVSLESCSVSLQCGGASGLFQPSSSGTQPNRPTTHQGPQGKRGPRGLPGPRGEKGDAAEQCECDAEIELRNELRQLQERLSRAEAALNPKTCRDVAPRYPNDTGGVFTIYPLTGGRQGIKVFCDFATDGGGWQVFQRRKDGSENFNRGWDDYVNGFGKLDGEFWLGLRKLHLITNSGDYEMRIDMEDFEGNKTYAFYGNFSVGRGSDYEMTHAHFSGPAGNGLTTTGARFSTKDKDQDTSSANCAKSYKGGWWFTNCHGGNPNGYYYGGPHESYADGVCWRPFRGYHYSLKIMELKIRRK